MRLTTVGVYFMTVTACVPIVTVSVSVVHSASSGPELADNMFRENRSLRKCVRVTREEEALAALKHRLCCGFGAPPYDLWYICIVICRSTVSRCVA